LVSRSRTDGHRVIPVRAEAVEGDGDGPRHSFLMAFGERGVKLSLWAGLVACNSGDVKCGDSVAIVSRPGEIIDPRILSRCAALDGRQTGWS
jgi:hypothetical protein